MGKPEDGNPNGGYVFLSIDESSSLSHRDSVKVEFIRFGYDVEKAAGLLRAVPCPMLMPLCSEGAAEDIALRIDGETERS